jgi:hypothetical protein
MLECAMCDMERGDTEPIVAFVFMLQGDQLQQARHVLLSRAVVYVVKTS